MMVFSSLDNSDIHKSTCSLVRVCGTNNWPAAGEKSQTFNEAGTRREAPWEDSAWRGDGWTISDSESAILTARLLLFR